MRQLVSAISISFFVLTSCHAKEEKSLKKSPSTCVEITSKDFKDPDLKKGQLKNVKMDYKGKNYTFKAVWCKEHKTKYRVMTQRLEICPSNVSFVPSPCPFSQANNIYIQKVNLRGIANSSKKLSIDLTNSTYPNIIAKCSEETYVYVCKDGAWFHAFLH